MDKPMRTEKLRTMYSLLHFMNIQILFLVCVAANFEAKIS